MTDVDWKDIRAKLSDPEGMTVKFRVGSTSQRKEGSKYPAGTRGQMLAYVDAREVMDRLDDVVGMGAWSDEYHVLEPATHAVECRLTVLGVTKADTGYQNAAGDDASKEPLKAAYSDAFKRAAVKFGVGRFLYDMDSPWVEIDEYGKPKQAMRQPMPQQQAIPPKAPRVAPAAVPASPPAAPAAASPLIEAAVAERAKWMAGQPVCPDPVAEALDIIAWRSDMLRVQEEWPWANDPLKLTNPRMKKLADQVIGEAGGNSADAARFLKWTFGVGSMKDLKEEQVALLERFVQGENTQAFLALFLNHFPVEEVAL